MEPLEPRLALTALPTTPEAWAAGIGVGSSSQLLADVNGDGRDDCVVAYTSGPLAGDWYVALSNGNSFTGFGKWTAGHGAGASWVGSADVTGDGRADAVIAFTSGGLAGNWYVAASTGSGFAAPTLWTTGHGAGSTAVALGDVDGDGKADAVAAFLTGTLAGNWYVARSSGSGFQAFSAWASGLGVGADTACLGDVTGDGRADAVAVYRSGTLAGNWYVSASSGSAFGNYSRWYEGHGAGAARVFLADVTGDGRQDALAYFSSGDFAGRWYVATSIGSTFVAAAQFRSELPGTPLSGDVTGDGTEDPVTFSPGDGAWRAKRSDWQYATTAVSTGGSRNLDFLAPALTLVIPVNVNAVSTGTITAPAASKIEVTGGGKIQQAGAINIHALAISPGLTNSSSSGLNLSGPDLSPTALLLTGSAVLTAPGGVTVSSVLGLSTGTSVSATTAVTVTSGGVIQGDGTIGGPLSIEAGGVLAPAFDAGATAPTGHLRIGRLTLAPGSEFDVDAVGSPTKVAHDQVTVTGPVVVTGSRLRLTNAGSWPRGSRVTLIDNQSSAFAEGIFIDAEGTPLPEGALLPAAKTGAGLDLWLTYRGGDGNDVALISNAAPKAVVLANTTTTLDENSDTTTRRKVADIVVTDDALGTNTITLTGPDAASFEVAGAALFLRAGVALDFESRASYAVTVSAADAGLPGSTPATVDYTLSVTDVAEPLRAEAVRMPGAGAYKAGEALVFTVVTSRPVTVAGGKPTIDIVAGGQVRSAVYVSGSGTGSLVFRYVVARGDNATSVVLGNMIKLPPGTTIRDATGTNLPRAIPGGRAAGATLDTVAPGTPAIVLGAGVAGGATEAEATQAAGVVTASGEAGSTIVVTLEGTAGPVVRTVTGQGPRVPVPIVLTKADVAQLGNGAVAVTAAASDAAGNRSPVATSRFSLDSAAPAALAVAVPVARTYRPGDLLAFTVTFQEPVFVRGTPFIDMMLEGNITRRATYVSGSGTKAIRFQYRVLAGDKAAGGPMLGTTIALNLGSIADAAGNAASLAISPPSLAGIVISPVNARAAAFGGP